MASPACSALLTSFLARIQAVSMHVSRMQCQLLPPGQFIAALPHARPPSKKSLYHRKHISARIRPEW